MFVLYYVSYYFETQKIQYWKFLIFLETADPGFL